MMPAHTGRQSKFLGVSLEVRLQFLLSRRSIPLPPEQKAHIANEHVPQHDVPFGQTQSRRFLQDFRIRHFFGVTLTDELEFLAQAQGHCRIVCRQADSYRLPIEDLLLYEAINQTLHGGQIGRLTETRLMLGNQRTHLPIADLDSQAIPGSARPIILKRSLPGEEHGSDQDEVQRRPAQEPVKPQITVLPHLASRCSVRGLGQGHLSASG